MIFITDMYLSSNLRQERVILGTKFQFFYGSTWVWVHIYGDLKKTSIIGKVIDGFIENNLFITTQDFPSSTNLK